MVTDLELLGQTATAAGDHGEPCRSNLDGLNPDSIPPGWILEGDPAARRKLLAGSSAEMSFLFPAGSRFHWTAPRYVRKIAFLRSPLSRKVQVARRIFKVLSSPFRRKSGPSAFAG